MEQFRADVLLNNTWKKVRAYEDKKTAIGVAKKTLDMAGARAARVVDLTVDKQAPHRVIWIGNNKNYLDGNDSAAAKISSRSFFYRGGSGPANSYAGNAALKEKQIGSIGANATGINAVDSLDGQVQPELIASIIPCPICTKPIKHGVTLCPHCGGSIVYNQVQGQGPGWLSIILLIIFLGGPIYSYFFTPNFTIKGLFSWFLLFGLGIWWFDDKK